MKTAFPVFAALVAGAVATLAGCTPFESKADPSRFYVLELPAAGKAEPAGWPFALGVQRVRLPEYLDRPQVVSRTPENRVTFSEFHRWPEAPEKAVSRVFADALARRLGATRVAREPSTDVYRDAVIVQLEALRFDGVLGGEVVLRGRWRATATHSGETLAYGDQTVSVIAHEDSYDAYVGALGDALDRFAGEVSAALRKRVVASPAGLPVAAK